MLNLYNENYTGWTDQVFSYIPYYNDYKILTKEELLEEIESKIGTKEELFTHHSFKYYLQNYKDEDKFICAYPIPSILKKEEDINYYNPVEVKTLFYKFSQLHKQNNEKIIKFASKYGLPQVNELNESNKNESIIYPLDNLIKKSKELDELVSVYDLITGAYSDKRSMRSRLNEANSKSLLFQIKREIMLKEGYEKIEFLTKEDLYLIFVTYLRIKLEERLSGKIVPTFNSFKINKDIIEKEWEVSPKWTCEELIPLLYLQLYFIITEKETIKRCEYCNEVFVPARSDQKFCSTSCRKKHHYHKNK